MIPALKHMYTFKIKDNSPNIDVLVTRGLLALASIASLLYQSNQYFFINVLSAVILVTAAIFVNTLLVKYKVDNRIVLIVAAILLFIATHAIIFAVVIIVYGLIVKKLYKEPVVNVNTEGVIFKKMFATPVHAWNEFNNIILKDNLLTLDFKNNKLLQLTILENETSIDEGSFNHFCSGFIGV